MAERVEEAMRAATRPASVAGGLLRDVVRSRDELIAENTLLAVRGASRFGDAVSATGCPGNGWLQSSSGGSPAPAFSIPGLSSAFASEPKARAQCGSSARWDPCGGRPEPRGKGRPYRDQLIDVSQHKYTYTAAKEAALRRRGAMPSVRPVAAQSTASRGRNRIDAARNRYGTLAHRKPVLTSR
jgi:hypothetical protein